MSETAPRHGKTQKSEPKKPSRGSGRDALIDATVRLAIQEGMSAITLRAVAREAGVTNGLVVYHFGTRSALVREALNRGPIGVDQRDFIDPASEDPAAVAAHLCGEIEQAPKQYIFVYQALLEAIRSGDLLDEHRENWVEAAELAAQALENAGVKRSSTFAWLVVAAIDGIALRQLLFDDRQKAEEILGELHQLIRDVAARDARSE